MSKAPAFQFYPSDWQRDMDDHPLEIEGAWIRICCRLYWSGGSLTKTEREWGRILRADLRQIRRIFAYFLQHNICDLVNQNGSITITSRRIVRDEHIRHIRKLSGIKGGNPALKQGKNSENLVNQTVNQNPTPSSSSSSSLTTKERIVKKENVEGGNGKPPRPSHLTDEEWLKQIKANPAYRAIDVDNEIAKCQAWCLTNKKTMSQRRILNWLNRAERPVVIGKAKEKWEELIEGL